MFTEEEKQIIEYGKQNGKSATEVKQALTKYRQTTGYTAPASPEPMDTVSSRVGNVIQNAGDKVSDAITGDGEFAERSVIRRGFDATAEAFKAVPGVAFASAPKPIRAGLSKVGNVLSAGFNKLVGAIGDNDLLQKWVMENPEAAKVVEEVAGSLKSSGEISGVILSANQLAKGLQSGVDKTSEVVQSTTESLKNTADDAFTWGKALKEKIRTKVGESAVDPQFKASADRLVDSTNGLKSTVDRLDDPVAAYDQYLSQSKNAITDIKVDPAISQVGEKIGNAFDDVVNQRRDIGTIMGEELKKVGNIKVDVVDDFATLETQLKDAGLVYDAVKHKLISSGSSKLATPDIKLLQDYIDDFNKLGSSPSVAQIDAHLSRTKSMVDYAKSAQGMTSTTPGERLIKIAQESLRTKLTPEGSGITDLASYAEARSIYSELSNFIDEGANYLGKLTQSGDFARDASLAKSAVQSILNQGKKDWLIKLESLTDYNAMDDAVLALQAMKDAGDFRGLSLLETMREGTIPTSPTGLTQKIWNFAIDQGKRVVAGTAEEQTRAFLKSLTTPTVDPTTVTAITRHLDSAKQIVANTPAETLTSMGGTPALLESTKNNIVMGLNAQDLTQASKAVSQVSTQGMTTLQQFEEAIKKALSSSTP
jgi:hypothetical protein